MGRNLDDVIKALSPERQAKVEALAQTKANEMIAAARSLADFRKALGKTQGEVGKQLGIKQHAVSQLEKRSDLYLSTLARFLDSLGMTLELALIAADGTRIPLDHFHPWNDGLKEFQGAGSAKSKNAASKQPATAKLSKPARAQGVVERTTRSSSATKARLSRSVNAERRP